MRRHLEPKYKALAPHLFPSSLPHTPSDPSNHYVNSVTILDGHDNIWNEDYHVVHHVSQCHWTENPAHYERNKAKYAEHKATIFQVRRLRSVGAFLVLWLSPIFLLK